MVRECSSLSTGIPAFVVVVGSGWASLIVVPFTAGMGLLVERGHARKPTAAAIPPSIWAITHSDSGTAVPGDSVGLNAPPAIAPTAKALATRVNPIARP